MGIFQNNQKTLIFFIVYCSSMISKSNGRMNGREEGIANFVFGDSLVDAGNNNYIMSLSKANYAPNGVDFGMPTGRYTNGRTIVDIIGKLLFHSTAIFIFFFSFSSVFKHALSH